jgi:hypothetical protein
VNETGLWARERKEIRTDEQEVGNNEGQRKWERVNETGPWTHDGKEMQNGERRRLSDW